MSDLTYLQAIVLGVVQGLTEFLPVSSSAHLAIAQRWCALDPESLPMHVFDGLVHIGTTLAVLIVFAGPLRRYGYRLIGELSSNWTGKRYALRILLLGVMATIPTGVIGLGFKKTFERAFGEPVWIGVGLLLTGVLLAVTAYVGRGKRGWKDFAWWRAVLVGIAQGIAIWPGMSRSGSTICAATFCGLRRRWAAEFSFFIAVPAIVGATALKLREAFAMSAENAVPIVWGPALVGAAVSLVVGVLSLRLLLGAVR
ncbi:MAG: undecaprenyl-diphosphate phosphatase, partial [Planctomycetota bacterium]